MSLRLLLPAVVLLAACLPSTAAALPRLAVEAGAPIADGAKQDARLSAPGFRGRIGIELRGSSSGVYRKPSYAFETRGPSGGEGRDAALLGLPAESDWILNSAYSDATYLRNALAYATARRLGHYAPRTRFVELRLNGEAEGLYVLTERVKVGRDRVDARDAGIDGAYVMELTDKQQAPKEVVGAVGPVTGRPYLFAHPRAKALTDAERGWIAEHLSLVERAVAERRPDWRTLLDEPSAVDFLLLQELFKNTDGFHRSTFLTKGSDAPLRFGPIWDFDRAMGDPVTPAFAGHEGWVSPGRPWAQQLLADPVFAQRVAARWRELRRGGVLRDLQRDLDRFAGTVRDAARRDVRRWPSVQRTPHRRAVAELEAWLPARVRWMDANLASLRPAG